MAQLWTTGPAHIYVATGKAMPGTLASALSAGSPLYLGTAEGAPDIQVEPSFTPVMNDIGGQKVPTDWMFDGAEALVVVDLTRWNEAVYATTQAWPASQDNTSGTFGAADIGTLMAHEGMTYDLWVQFPYQTKTAYTNMPGGYHFLSAFCIGPSGITPGTRASKRRCIFKAIRAYNTSDGTWGLYDHTVSGLPAVPPTGDSGAVSS